MYLTAAAAYGLYPVISEKIKSSSDKKPKTYYQFWATHVLIIALAIYTGIDYANNYQSPKFLVSEITVLIIVSSIGSIIIFAFMSILQCCNESDIEIKTPTDCCKCHNICTKCCPCLLKYSSLIVLSFFFNYAVLFIPTVIMIFILTLFTLLSDYPSS